MPLETFNNLESLASVRSKLNLAIEAINDLEASGAGVWGNITGTLASQTDLQTALNLKANTASLAPVATAGTYASLTGIPSTFAPSSHTQAFSTLTSLPTTLAGYGITDAYTETEVDTFLALKSDKTVPSTTLTYAATVNLDMAVLTGEFRTINLTGNLTLTTSNRANGRQVAIRLIADTSNRTLTFPAGWIFLNSTVPTFVSANKTAILSLTFFGSNNSDCIASYGEQL
jgi:hypothetical protein